MATSKLVDVRQIDLKRNQLIRNVSGSDSAGSILGIIPLGAGPTIDRALDDALNKVGGDLMTDINITHTVYPLILFTWTSIRVTGSVHTSQKQ